MLACEPEGAGMHEMPGVQRQELTSAQRRKLQRALERIDRAEAEVWEARKTWALLVRDELGQAACAREMGLTDAAIWARIQYALKHD
jgi:hypothetical protein